MRAILLLLAVVVAIFTTFATAAFDTVRIDSNGDVVLLPPPTNGSKNVIDASIIWVEGAGLKAAQYSEIASRVQYAAASKGIRLWIGIPQCLLSICEPLVIGTDIKRVYSALTAKGLPTTATTFAAAHSAGGVFLDMLVANPPKDFPVKFSGVILMGSFILRSANKTWQHPVLQIAGELDGLCRITRMAQSYHFQLAQRGGLSNAAAVRDFPVGVIKGGSHMTFASGTPPTLVKDEDLVPNITFAQAHTEVATHISNWLVMQLYPSFFGTSGSAADAKTKSTFRSASSAIFSWVNFSYVNYFEPILDAFEEEGNYHLKPPCNCENSCNPADIPAGDAQCGNDPFGKVNYNPCFPSQIKPFCRAGQKWGKQIQQFIGTYYPAENQPTLPFSVDVSSGFHPVSQTKPHSNLPYVFNNCSSPQQNCNLRANIISENVYTPDPLDTGFFVQSAQYTALKMKSRQWIRQQAGYTNVSFNVTDGPDTDFCQQANKLAVEWALKRLAPDQAYRYEQLGQKIIWGPDSRTIVGPVFIDAKLERKYDDASAVVQISSPSLVTKADGIVRHLIPSAAAMHYCKVLSPANALEWMILDGLRLKNSLKNH